MKTIEFVRKINDLEYYYIKLKDCDEKILYICHKHKGDIIAAVHIEKIGVINTFYREFDKLTIYKQEQLFELLSKYSQTPIAERGEEKKYMYRVKNMNVKYLTLNKINETFVRSSANNSNIFKTHFTHSELKSLGVNIKELQETYEEIEVEGDIIKEN